MAVLVIILDDTGHQLNNHLMEIHPVLGVLSMAKAMPEYIEALEPPVKCLLAVQDEGSSSLRWMASLIQGMAVHMSAAA